MSETEVIQWIRQQRLLEALCEVGGWPDTDHAQIDICSRSDAEWIANITFTEAIREISECEVAEYSRCGKFAIRFDAAGNPYELRLLYPM